MKCQKFLVTGGAGFIGSHLVDRLIEENHKIVVVDNLSTGKEKNLNPKAKFYKVNICSPKISQIFRIEKPKVVFHFAANIDARKSTEDPIFDAQNNILGSLNVLENCRRFKIKKVIFASSGGEIYGQADKIPTPETYPLSPISPYGVAKLAIEKYLAYYYKSFKIPYLALRYGNVYGPRQNPEGEAGVVAIFTDRMLKNKQPLIHGSGKQTKDYIFIEDVIDATILAHKKGVLGALNIGTGKETSVLEIFYKIKKLTGSKIQKKHTSFPIIGIQRACLSSKKAKKELNWQSMVSLNRGIEDTVKWFNSVK